MRRVFDPRTSVNASSDVILLRVDLYSTMPAPRRLAHPQNLKSTLADMAREIEALWHACRDLQVAQAGQQAHAAGVNRE